jgi:ubiquitin-like-conjugating enzyme ATG3
MQALQSQYFQLRERFSPVLKESKFKESGRITPEEFVAAGDFLTYKFPVWSWERGDAGKARDYLPAEKQYLVTRGVPCLRRATSLAYTDADEDAEKLLSFTTEEAEGKEDEWVQTHAGRSTNESKEIHEIDDIPDDDAHAHADDLSKNVANMSLRNPANADAIPDIDDIPDMEDMEEAGLEAEDAAAAKPVQTIKADAQTDSSKANLLQVRTYDVMITYDKYYQTPRIWLLGYDENGTPLTPTQIFQDISADHAQKTVTIETFLHSTTLSAASVHPCKHADVMMKVIERMNAGVIEQQRKAAGISSSKPGNNSSSSSGGGRKWLGGVVRKVTGSEKPSDKNAEGDDVEGMRVDFYLVVFLKFIASIVPTIEVDSTTAF